jgi:hypothetical protein
MTFSINISYSSNGVYGRLNTFATAS